MAADMIYVGCKMPMGVVLNLSHYEVVNKEHSVVQRVGEEHTVTLKGNGHRQERPDLSIDGFGFTAVPRDFWDEWLKTHADSPLLRDGFIKPALSVDAQKKVAREHEKEPGMFPRLTEADPRTKNLDRTLKAYNADDVAA